MKLRLQTKVLLSTGALILLVLGINSFVQVQNLKRYYLDAITWRSETLTESIIQEAVSKYNISPDTTNIELLLNTLSVACIQLYEANQQRDVSHVAVINAAGVIAAHNNRERWNTPVENPILLAALQQRQRMTVVEGDTYHTFVPFFGKGDAYLGTVDIGVPKRLVDQKVHEILLYAVAVLAGFWLFTFIVTSVLMNAIVTKPINRLITIGQKIARGEVMHLSRVRKHLFHDEVGTLEAVFANMIGYLQHMAALATTIAEGDLRQTSVPLSAQDMLGVAFQRMTTYLEHLSSAMTHIAEGDLRGDVQPASEHDLVGKAVAQQIQALRRIISHIIENADKVSLASVSLSEISEHMAADANVTSLQLHTVSTHSLQVSNNISTVSTATGELSLSIQEIERNVSHVMDLMTKAVEIANTANTRMQEMEQRSHEIGEIIKIITTITQQTNLLALNATIEAARAGDVGRGFAVVAHEIKELSKEIAASAEQITHTIEAMQTSSQNVMEGITEVSTIIHHMHEFSQSITSAVNQQTATTRNISHNFADAAHESTDVTRAITDVATVMQNTEERAKHVREAAEELAALAEQLQQQVSTFKV